MKFEIFIARRLRLSTSDRSGSPSLNVALVGIVLAIVIMILSIAIVMGFKSEITNKIYALDSHLKVTNAVIGLDDNFSTVDCQDIYSAVMKDANFKDKVASMSLIAEKPAILKTDNDFKGIEYRGVGSGYDWSYLKDKIIAGRLPNIDDTASVKEIIISKTIADQLQLKVGDKILTYFIDNKVKVRNSHIVGIFNTDFETFDKSYIIGNIALIQQVNGWNGFTGNYVGINLKNIDNVNNDSYQLYSLLAKSVYERGTSTLYNVTNTHRNNLSFFTWLSMLDMNVVIIIILMIVVSAFTLISALLMIILERIKMVGMLKALGANNHSIRRIFIYLTQKLIIKSIIIGNIIGIALALIQKYLHIVKLDPEAYYMPYVPISLNLTALILLNAGIIILSYITLIGPSYIVTSIKPTSTMRFE
jgi:lipoprotein-releasing system permease protein